ncbi:MAG: hypothetical protein NUV51_01600 [Sulfuricaulis sp.]|nr:hypothetical protein [Sulfuricaulis sp.]
MTDDEDSNGEGYKGIERRNKVRRSGKQRRDQSRWNMDNPIRRKGRGRRTHDRLPKKSDPKR